MNGKKAKALRRMAYGDLSLKVERRYTREGQTFANGPMTPRAIYQAMKRSVT